VSVGSVWIATAGFQGLPRTKTLVTGASCSTQSGPIVNVSQPGAVHCVTIGMSLVLPPLNQAVTVRNPEV
jgi:hypothetical protein